MCWHGGQHLLFAIDQVGGIEGRNFEAVPVGDGIGRAGLYAVSAKDAAVVINVIDLGVTLGPADAVFSRIFRRLNINAVGRTSRRAQEAGPALLRSILIALQYVHTAETLL